MIRFSGTLSEAFAQVDGLSWDGALLLPADEADWTGESACLVIGIDEFEEGSISHDGRTFAVATDVQQLHSIIRHARRNGREDFATQLAAFKYFFKYDAFIDGESECPPEDALSLRTA